MRGFLNRMFGRGDKSPVGLVEGRLSTLSRAACKGDYVASVLGDAGSQKTRFSMFFYLMFFQAAEMLIQTIEKDRKLMRFFNGTSRDVLIFEAFSFYSFFIIERNRDKIGARDARWADALSRYSKRGADLGYSLASDLVGKFRQARHRKQRLEPMINHRGNAMQMVETFCRVMLCANGRQRITDPDAPPPLDADTYASLAIRKIAIAATLIATVDFGKSIESMFSEDFDSDVYEEEE